MEQLKFSNWLDRPKSARVWTLREWQRVRKVFGFESLARRWTSYWNARRCRWPRAPLIGPLAGPWCH